MPKGACPANKYFKTVYLDDVPASECMFCGISWKHISGTKQTAHPELEEEE